MRSVICLLLWLIPASAQAFDGRPARCPHIAWCGCWMAEYLGIRDHKLWRDLWVARNWAKYGRPAPGPAPGVIAVYPHHVGKVTAVPKPGVIEMLSGNDGRQVRQRQRSIKGVIAWRYP